MPAIPYLAKRNWSNRPGALRQTRHDGGPRLKGCIDGGSKSRTWVWITAVGRAVVGHLCKAFQLSSIWEVCGNCPKATEASLGRLATRRGTSLCDTYRVRSMALQDDPVSRQAFWNTICGSCSVSVHMPLLCEELDWYLTAYEFVVYNCSTENVSTTTRSGSACLKHVHYNLCEAERTHCLSVIH